MLREPILFGDYRNSLTGEPRVYEDVVDYEAAKAVFEEVRYCSDFIYLVICKNTVVKRLFKLD